MNYQFSQIFLLAVISVISLLPATPNAFTIAPHPSQNHPFSSVTTSTTQLYSTTVQKKGSGNGKIKEALKKMRGTSISVGYVVNVEDEISSMDMEILSQQLRKAKTASIFTSNMKAINEFSKEQEMARGNFPGPCPIVYDGDISGVQDAIDNGASAIVVNAMDFGDNLSAQNDENVEIICRVGNKDDVQMAINAGFEYAFLLPSDDDDGNLVEMLSIIPKDAVIISSLKAMQKNSYEITRGKELIGLEGDSTTGTGSKINGLLIDDACVGDEEDMKYTTFVVGGLTKKASSTFAMTGLTGSTNGHFGTMSDNASVENAKWRRTSTTS